MKIGIIIVSYNGLKVLPMALKSATEYGEDFPIYVVENASTDGSLEYLKKNWPNIKLIISHQNTGFAAGNNLGIKQALADGAEALLLLNQDAELKPGCVKKLQNFLNANPGLAVAQPRVNLPDGRVNSLGNCYHYLGFGIAGGNGLSYERALQVLPWFKNMSEIPYFSGAAVLIRSEALRQVGLFDGELFLYHEDLELGLRLRSFGWGMQVLPEAEVVHYYHFASSINNFYYMERNRWLVWLTYFKFPTLLVLALPMLAADLALLISSIFSGWFWAYIKSRGYLFTPKAWRYIYKKRQRVKKFKQVSDNKLLSYAVSKIHFQEKDGWPVKYIFNPLSNLGWFIIKPLIRW